MYLLDTHVILWWLTETDVLSLKARQILSDPHNVIYVSSVSFWEMAVKSSLGRLTLPRNILKLLSEEGFKTLPLLPEEGLAVVDLPMLHNDPFDRALVAQAKYNDLVLITRDAYILEYPIATVLA